MYFLGEPGDAARSRSRVDDTLGGGLGEGLGNLAQPLGGLRAIGGRDGIAQPACQGVDSRLDGTIAPPAHACLPVTLLSRRMIRHERPPAVFEP